jgi:hypothetical protein
MKLYTIVYRSLSRKETTIRCCNLKADDMVQAIRLFDDENGSDYEILSITFFSR